MTEDSEDLVKIVTLKVAGRNYPMKYPGNKENRTVEQNLRKAATWLDKETDIYAKKFSHIEEQRRLTFIALDLKFQLLEYERINEQLSGYLTVEQSKQSSLNNME